MKENCFEPLDLDVVNDLENIMRMKVIGNLDLILTHVKHVGAGSGRRGLRY